MRAMGITRKMDNLNRLVIPKELCKSLNIGAGTPMEILANDKGIYLKKSSVGCTFCQSVDDVVAWHGVLVCKVCAGDILAKSVKESVGG